MTNINIIIHNLIYFVHKIQESSLSLPAQGWVEARVTSLFSAARQLTLAQIPSASKARARRKGGCGGNSASPEPKRSPAALLGKSRVPQKSFLFLLEEKIGRAQNKKLRRKLFCGTASEASGGGAERISQDFVQNEF